MDEIELLVEQTYRFHQEKFPESAGDEVLPIMGMRAELDMSAPDKPGLIYHIQKTSGLFVLRSLPSKNLRQDFERIQQHPEDYPVLRLVDEKDPHIKKRLNFFVVSDHAQAELIHSQVSNRRFPIDEESLCNLSDPGFSWWFCRKENGFQISFNHAYSQGLDLIKLGPLGDQKVAVKQLDVFLKITQEMQIPISLQLEPHKFNVDGAEEQIVEGLRHVFEFGLISQTIHKLFKILATNPKYLTEVETLWYYFDELSAMRKFWIKIYKELS